jgi:hypothetical protein
MKNKFRTAAVCAAMLLAGCISSNAASPQSANKFPYYFIAVHFEPYHDRGRAPEEHVKDAYESVLLKMIAQADAWNIKLTLMFSTSWADYISADPERLAALAAWKKKGHEIGAHHHSVYHQSWDGYSGKPDALAMRKEKCKNPEQYQGGLPDYMKKLKKINPGINSGCFNEEASKAELPDEIIYSTCSGFSNHLGVGIREDDGLGPEKGINKYVTAGVYNGIQRKWLTHYQTTHPERILKTQEVLKTMDASEVYGAVVHGNDREQEAFLSLAAFLHQQDPTGAKSRTVTEVIEQKILPEKEIPAELLKQEEPMIGGWVCKCGDGVCDDFEQSHPLVCPRDCRK